MKTTPFVVNTLVAEHPVSIAGRRSRVYVVIAVLSLFTALGGFSLTYFVPLTTGTFEGRALLHVHGAMYFVWLLLFILQPVLVRTRNTALHRKLGVAGFVLAGLMILMGVAVSITGAKLNSPGLAVAGLQPSQFLLIPLTDMVLFAGFLAFSLANLRRFEYHKRLMVLATLSLLPAAFGRLTVALGLTHPAIIILMTESLLIGVVVFDWITRKKIHPAYAWGAAVMILVHFLRFPAASSSWWTNLSSWIIS